MNTKDITIEEKIDYIYETLRKKEKYDKIWFFFRWGTRVFILILVLYFYKVTLPQITQNIWNMLTPDIDISQAEIIETFKKYFPNSTE